MVSSFLSIRSTTIMYFLIRIEASGVAEPIPIPNVKGKTLKRVIDYCVAHKGKIPLEIEKPLKSANFAQVHH
jgi:hypothetical protein